MLPTWLMSILVSMGVRWVGWHFASKVVYRFEDKVMELYHKGMDKRKARAKAAKEIASELKKDHTTKAPRKITGSTSRSPQGHVRGHAAVSARPARGPERVRHHDRAHERERKGYKIPSREEHARTLSRTRDMSLVRREDRYQSERRDSREDRRGFPVERHRDERYYGRDRASVRPPSREPSIQRNNYSAPKRAIAYDGQYNPFDDNMFPIREVSRSKNDEDEKPERRRRRTDTSRPETRRSAQPIRYN